MNVIGDVILFLGKLSVSLTSALFAFLMLDTHKYKSGHNKITSPLFPVLVHTSSSRIVLSICIRLWHIIDDDDDNDVLGMLEYWIYCSYTFLWSCGDVN